MWALSFWLLGQVAFGSDKKALYLAAVGYFISSVIPFKRRSASQVKTLDLPEGTQSEVSTTKGSQDQREEYKG
jgi:hypothetical protein